MLFKSSFFRLAVFFGAWFWAMGNVIAHAQEKDPFADLEKPSKAAAGSKKADADDPFSPANEAKAAAPARPGDGLPPSKIEKNRFIEDRIDFEVTMKPGRVRRGQTIQLAVVASPKPGYHTYPITKRAANPAHSEGFAPRWTYEDSNEWKPLWPIGETEPRFENIEGSGWFLIHEDPVTWTQDILVLPQAVPGRKTLRFKIDLQVCDEKGCVPGVTGFETYFDVTSEPAIPLAGALADRLKAKQPEVRIVPVPGTTVGDPGKGKSRPDGTNKNKASVLTESRHGSQPVAAASSLQKSDAVTDGLIGFILQGVFFGGLSLLTPCVFPMIPITVSFFLKQSEKQNHRPFTMATVYSGTIVAVLTIGGLLLMRVLQPLSQHWSTNLVLGGLFVFFALSLFGMYEIRLPTGLANYTSSHESQGGLVGVIFMALTFTIISFTCVAPFYGGFIALAAAAQSAADWAKLVLGALAFSVTFASPFFILALFPTLLRSMPRSGSWMNTVKVVMGFLELAAALKFLRGAELSLFAGAANLFTYDLVLGMYVALSLACGAYLLALYRLPHDDSPPEHLGVPRLLFSLLFLSLGFYLLPAQFRYGPGIKQRPTGTVFSWLDAFLLPSQFEDAEGLRSGGEGAEARPGRERLEWSGNLKEQLETAYRENALVFVDFTGVI